MITGLYLRNFKAFEELSLDLGPITLLLGPNNSGKSSVLAVPRILVQTAESYDSHVPILLNGIMGDFGTYKDIVYDNNRRRHVELHVATAGRTTRPYQPQLVEEDWPLANTDSQTIVVKYSYRARRREIVLRGTELKTDGQVLLVTKYAEDSERQLIERVGRQNVPSTLKSTLSKRMRMQNFIPHLPYGFGRSYRDSEKGALDAFLSEESEDVFRVINNISRNLSIYLRSIEYLGAMRLPPSRTYLFTGERRQRIGANGENAASVLVMDSARSGSRSRNIAQSVGDWLNKAGIASELRVQRISDRHYEIRLQHPQTKEYQNFADVGYGNSQVLPVLVGGFNLSAGSTYIVEEPEIHLHPRAQAELGDFFLNLYRRNVQSVVETHSEHLILRLQQHVAGGILPAAHVHIYYVYAKDNKKCVERLRLDDKGHFIDAWPEGFFPERLEEAKKLSRIRHQQIPN